MLPNLFTRCDKFVKFDVDSGDNFAKFDCQVTQKLGLLWSHVYTILELNKHKRIQAGSAN